ncbi:MAG: 3'-5' exonuclease, partial [Nocardioides sp.]
MPLDPELADLREFLASEGIAEPPEQVALTFRPRGSRLGAGDDVVLVRSGAVDDDRRVTDDALLVVRPSAVAPTALRLLALDVETTGLVPGLDRLVSVGWVPVDGDRLDLAGARRFVVRGDDPGAAADIHGLTRDDLVAGTPLPEVLSELRRALEGRALLAHHATFDLAFLQAAFRQAGERMPRVPVVCTLTLHKRLLRADRRAKWPAGALRLWTARERFGLQAGRPHDALGDALACAELYLGQVAELGGHDPL